MTRCLALASLLALAACTSPADVAGTYTIALTNRANGCNLQNWTVGETIDFLRAAKDLPDDFYDLFVVDPTHKPLGSIPLSRAMRSPRTTRLTSVSWTSTALLNSYCVPKTSKILDLSFLFIWTSFADNTCIHVSESCMLKKLVHPANAGTDSWMK